MLPVDVEKIARHRGLQIVGSSNSGYLKLPRGRKAVIRLDLGLIVVRADLYDDDSKEVELLEAVAHELGHDALHGDQLAQRPLPFGPLDFKNLSLGRLGFSREGDTSIEREAIYFGALLQVPYAEMRACIRRVVLEYATGKWASMSPSANSDEEGRSVILYSSNAVKAICKTLRVSADTAKIALDYWGASVRPPQEWVSEEKEARRASLR